MARLADKAALILLGIAVVGWYAASRAASESLGAGKNAPGRRAFAFWLPVALTSLAAVIIGRAEIAIGVIFSTSVAAMTLVLGIVTISARHTLATMPRRAWSFVLPAALLTLLIGLSGGIRWIHIAILVLEGLALYSLWNDTPMAQVASVDPTHPPSHAAFAPTHRSSKSWQIALLIFAIVAAGVSAWAGVTAAVDLSNNMNLPSAGLVAALFLGPGLVLAMIGSGSAAAHEGHFDQAVASQVGFVLLNLCALLPLTAALWLTRPTWYPPREAIAAAATTPPSSQAVDPTTNASSPDAPDAMPYPMAVWRVDTVLLVAAGMLLLPVALGRWSLGNLEGFAMLVGYLIYMAMTAYMARGG
jgi:Ca2+/Na+ antiporter